MGITVSVYPKFTFFLVFIYDFTRNVRKISIKKYFRPIIYKCLNISEKIPTGHYYIEQCCLGNCRYICFNICAKHSSDNDKEASIVIVF